MRFAISILAGLVLLPLFTQCGGSAPQSNSVTGPFNSRGEYVEDWVNKPERWFRPTTTPEKKVAKRKKEAPQIAVVQPQIQPTRVVSRPPAQAKPKPRPTVKPKPKPKPRPSFASHKVRRGDTLTNIARRYRTTISKIKRANGLSGSLIRIGETLKIPR